MTIKRITAMVPAELLESLEKCLRACGVPGMTVDEVRGFGEHANFFSSDLMLSNARVEVFLPESKVDSIIRAIVEFAREEHPTSGILLVENVERMVNLNNGADITCQ